MCELLTTLEACSRWNKTTEDDVLLQAAQAVYRAAQRGIDENLRRLLKGGGGEERASRKRALLNAEHNLSRLRYNFPCVLHLLHRPHNFPILHDVADRVVGVAGIGNLHAREHLLYYDLQVFTRHGCTLHLVDL